MRTVGVVSDTHIPGRAVELPRDLLRALEQVDLILHAGDLVRIEVLDALRKLAPVEAVAGNVDDAEVRLALPRRKVIGLSGYRIGLVHGDTSGVAPLGLAMAAFGRQPAAEAVQAVVFGHSHRAHRRMHDGVLYLNPGSPTDPRGSCRPSFGLLHLDGAIRGEIVCL